VVPHTLHLARAPGPEALLAEGGGGEHLVREPEVLLHAGVVGGHLGVAAGPEAAKEAWARGRRSRDERGGVLRHTDPRWENGVDPRLVVNTGIVARWEDGGALAAVPRAQLLEVAAELALLVKPGAAAVADMIAEVCRAHIMAGEPTGVASAVVPEVVRIARDSVGVPHAVVAVRVSAAEVDVMIEAGLGHDLPAHVPAAHNPARREQTGRGIRLRST
jgi:hypothetical protein